MAIGDLGIPSPNSSGSGGGDASAANQLTEITSLQLIDDAVATTASAIPAKGIAVSGTDGTNARILKTDTSGELQIDVLSSALPSGASTAAKQPALGTAGTASSDVITVQGIASMTALKVDGSAVTQPVSYATTGSGNATGALRVELANNGTGALSTVSTVTNVSQNGGVNISLNAGAVDTGTRRVVQANGAGKTILSAGGSASSSGNNTLVAAGTNKLKVKAFSLTTTSTTAMTCIFQSGAGGTELWRVIIQAPTGASAGANLACSAPDWLFATASATLLNLNLSSANAVHWSVSYYDEA